MDEDLTLAFAVARALVTGKSQEELARLQILLQTVSSLVAAELGCKRLAGSSAATKGGASQ